MEDHTPSTLKEKSFTSCCSMKCRALGSRDLRRQGDTYTQNPRDCLELLGIPSILEKETRRVSTFLWDPVQEGRVEPKGQQTSWRLWNWLASSYSHFLEACKLHWAIYSPLCQSFLLWLFRYAVLYELYFVLIIMTTQEINEQWNFMP